MFVMSDRPGKIVPPQEPPSPKRPEPPVVTPPPSPDVPPTGPTPPIGDPPPTQPPIQAAGQASKGIAARAVEAEYRRVE